MPDPDEPEPHRHEHGYRHGHEHGGAPMRPEDMDWDEHYRAAGQIWSGHPNGSLIDEVDARPPGRALDVGCGEGADAIWLAERGWSVTAIDVAPTAVARGRTEADARDLAIEWRAGDLLTEPLTVAYDLVSVQYPAFAKDRTEAVTRRLTDLLAPGGLLLVVGHAPPDDPSTSSFDFEAWMQPTDLVQRLPDAFEVELAQVRPRPGDHHADSPHSHDVVVRIRAR